MYCIHCMLYCAHVGTCTLLCMLHAVLPACTSGWPRVPVRVLGLLPACSSPADHTACLYFRLATCAWACTWATAARLGWLWWPWCCSAWRPCRSPRTPTTYGSQHGSHRLHPPPPHPPPRPPPLPQPGQELTLVLGHVVRKAPIIPPLPASLARLTRPPSALSPCLRLSCGKPAGPSRSPLVGRGLG